MTLPQTADIAATSTERVSDLVHKLVAAATAEVDAAAQRTRAQAQVEITHLQRTLDQLRAELQAEREKLTAAAQELTVARASTSQLMEELESERAEKARFAATLETVRLLVSGIDPEYQGPDPTSLPDRHTAEAHDELAEPAPDANLAEFQSGDRSTAKRVLTAVAAPSDAGRVAHDDITGHLAQLVGQIEEIYRSDLDSAQSTFEVVGRLAANLAYARDVFARRLESADGRDAQLFDRHLARLLEMRSGTPFGRDLAMALRRPVLDLSTSTELQKEAS
jgi:small-conductance mechanosensitive channel